MIDTNKVLTQAIQYRDSAYPIVDTIDKRSKTAQVKMSPSEIEVWTVHLILPTNFEQCIVTDNWYVVKNVKPEE